MPAPQSHVRDYRRFALALADDGARLRADVGRYSFTVRDSHPLLLAGLPAHSKNHHISGYVAGQSHPAMCGSTLSVSMVNERRLRGAAIR